MTTAAEHSKRVTDSRNQRPSSDLLSAALKDATPKENSNLEMNFFPFRKLKVANRVDT